MEQGGDAMAAVALGQASDRVPLPKDVCEQLGSPETPDPAVIVGYEVTRCCGGGSMTAPCVLLGWGG